MITSEWLTGLSSMLHIITGGIDHGKTTRLLSIYREIGRGDGIVTLKLFINGHNAGQEVMRLSTGEKKQFSFRNGFIPESGWQEKHRYGPYSFSAEGLEFAEAVIRSLFENGCEPVFIDEIGPLELEDKGLHYVFSKLTAAKRKDAWVVIRENCVRKVICKYLIADYAIIKV